MAAKVAPRVSDTAPAFGSSILEALSVDVWRGQDRKQPLQRGISFGEGWLHSLPQRQLLGRRGSRSRLQGLHAPLLNEHPHLRSGLLSCFQLFEPRLVFSFSFPPRSLPHSSYRICVWEGGPACVTIEFEYTEHTGLNSPKPAGQVFDSANSAAASDAALAACASSAFRCRFIYLPQLVHRRHFRRRNTPFSSVLEEDRSIGGGTTAWQAGGSTFP